MSATPSFQDLCRRLRIAAANDDLETLEAVWTSADDRNWHTRLREMTWPDAMPEYGIVEGDSPLIIAAKRGHLKVIRWLFLQGFGDLSTLGQPSCLDHTAALGHTAVLSELLTTTSRGTRLKLRNVSKDRLAPLDRAIHGGHLSCVLLLEDAIDAVRSMHEEKSAFVVRTSNGCLISMPSLSLRHFCCRLFR